MCEIDKKAESSKQEPDRLSVLLRSRMAEGHITQSKLAEGLGTSQSYVSQIINGSRAPAFPLLRSITERLGFSEEEFAQMLEAANQRRETLKPPKESRLTTKTGDRPYLPYIDSAIRRTDQILEDIDAMQHILVGMSTRVLAFRGELESIRSAISRVGQNPSSK